MATLTICAQCGGTGEGFRAGMQGDGWTGKPCDWCNGWGDVIVIEGKSYPRTGKAGQVYRYEKGHFRSWQGHQSDDFKKAILFR